MRTPPENNRVACVYADSDKHPGQRIDCCARLNFRERGALTYFAMNGPISAQLQLPAGEVGLIRLNETGTPATERAAPRAWSAKHVGSSNAGSKTGPEESAC